MQDTIPSYTSTDELLHRPRSKTPRSSTLNTPSTAATKASLPSASTLGSYLKGCDVRSSGLSHRGPDQAKPDGGGGLPPAPSQKPLDLPRRGSGGLATLTDISRERQLVHGGIQVDDVRGCALAVQVRGQPLGAGGEKRSKEGVVQPHQPQQPPAAPASRPRHPPVRAPSCQSQPCPALGGTPGTRVLSQPILLLPPPSLRRSSFFCFRGRG